jgi:hypothetical protein
MTPKEKAKELFDKMVFQIEWNAQPSTVNGVAKQCVLIAVDEIINNNSKIPGLLTQDTMHNTWYWQEVKQEIEKL